MTEPSVTTQGGSSASIGLATDPPATVGDGGVIGLLKAHRASLAVIAGAAIITGGVIVGGALKTAPATATLLPPVYTEGATVPLSTDLTGALRLLPLGGGGGNPTAGRLDSLRRIDSLRYVAAGRLDSLRRLDTLRTLASVLAGRLDSVRRVDTVRAIADRGTLTTGGTIGAVQLGSSTGKTNVYLTGSITTTAVTADQVILTRTVTAAKTLYVSYACIQARLTAVSATASILGAASIETPSGTKIATFTFTNLTTSESSPVCVPIVEPIGVAAAAVIRCVVTPAATTSMLWICNFGGYER